MRVMVVEDEKRARTLSARLLNLVDPNIQIVGECANGKEGLGEIPEKVPDIVFVDIRMPVMDGLEMIRRLRRKSLDTEYIIITGYSDFQYAKQAVDLNVSGFILKPVTYEDIAEVLQKYKSKKGHGGLDPKVLKNLPVMRVHELKRQCESLLVKRTIRYVNDHIGVQVRLAETARAIHVSPEHLSRLFREELGMTFTDYVRLIKIDYSMVLLRKTDIKVQEIARTVGMDNVNYFYNVFREVLGMTPRQYRLLQNRESATEDQDEPQT